MHPSVRVLMQGTLLACPLLAPPGSSSDAAQADRTAYLARDGVLRWRDDDSEVALFGVNYYPPFSMDWKAIRDRGLDHRTAIRQDVAHFHRMGLTAIRLHCWDREISDRRGNLLENDHLDLLDYLIGQCKARGIYTVLTPIAWWATPNESDGFSNDYTMDQMTTDPEARAAQMRYLRQFAQHRNRYTGLSYKDDPAVVAFELINEPLFPAGVSDEDVTKYVDDLAGAIKATGCDKPIFFNGWGGRLKAVANSTVEGCSFGWYPTGLASGAALTRNYLPRVEDYPAMRAPALARKAKIVYEFDAADVPWSYMYPAMARAFRSGGAQIATQFQYDPMAIAATNENWQTHFLNLCYTPKKAVSFMIAAQAFYRLPRLHQYGRSPGSDRFDVFRVDYDRRLSEMVTDDVFMYSNDTDTNPPAPSKLRLIVGCGSSPLVRYEGTGAYFLEMLADGAWKLTVYPDAVWVRDPYSGGRAEKVRIFWRDWQMKVSLPDLGDNFTVVRLAPDKESPTDARRGAFRVRPGTYVCVARGKKPPPVDATFVAPVGSVGPPAVYHEPPTEWVAGRPWRMEAVVASPAEPQSVVLHLRCVGETASKAFDMKRKGPYEWSARVPGEFLKPGEWRYAVSVTADGRVAAFPAGVGDDEAPFGPPKAKPVVLFSVQPDDEAPELECGLPEGETCEARVVEGSAAGRAALRMAATGFGEPPSCVALKWPTKPPSDHGDAYNALTIRARGDARTPAVEVSLVEDDGSGFGYNVPLGPAWRTARVPLSKLRPLWTTKRKAVDLSRVTHVCFVFGSWLYGPADRGPHALDVESVALTQEETGWPLAVVGPKAPAVLFSGDDPLPALHGDVAATATRVVGMAGDRLALRIAVDGFGPEPSCVSFRPRSPKTVDARRAALSDLVTLHVRARAGQPATDRVEVVLLEEDGAPWGVVLALTDEWRDIVVPLSQLVYFKHWKSGPESRGGPGDRFHPERVESVNVCFGAWLYPEKEARPHAVEIDSISLEAE